MFEKLIESGRRLVARNERYRHKNISEIPLEERMASSETEAWFKAAREIIIKTFGENSTEFEKWDKLQDKLWDETAEERRLGGVWNEAEWNVRKLHDSMGLLTELDIYANMADEAVKQRSHRLAVDIPLEIQDTLNLFKADYPEPKKVAFLMMRFGKTIAHEKIVEGIKKSLDPLGIVAVRADDKQYHDDLFPNILTYVYGCGFGIAIFERIETEEFNPNVALEVGYMLALRKQVCLLKDRTLKTLHADLVGKLYRSFEPLDPVESIPGELTHWLRDKGLAKASA